FGRVDICDQTAKTVQIGAGTERISQTTVRSDIRGPGYQQRAGHAERGVQSKRLLERAIGPKWKVHILIVGAQHQPVAGEVAAEGKCSLAASARNQLQEAESRRKILAHRARQDSRGFSRGGVRVRPALEVVRVYLKPLTDSAPRVQVCSLRAAPRGIGGEQPGAEIIAPNME